jgi:Tfp pilus assembly protein PilP
MFLFISYSWSAADPRLNEFFKGKTSIKDPASLRDPFKAPFIPSNEAVKKEEVIRTNFSNVPPVPELPIEGLQVVGVLIGENRKAIVSVGGKTYVLNEGMKLGPNKADLKAILPGGIVLVEKITNVYGQEEYLETVIPISQ